MNFIKGSQYTRSDIWKSYHPDSGEKPKGGNWDTGYVVEGDDLIAFLNIDSAGRTGHDFANAYDSEKEEVIWFGKPNTHSSQPIFKKLINKELKPHFFARWNSKNTKFIYLGVGQLMSFEDGFPIPDGKSTIKMNLSLSLPNQTIGIEGVIDSGIQKTPSFAKKIPMLVNRYERDPNKRIQCIEHHGYKCQICNFSFFDTYSVLGEEFCHVHHIEPLGEVGGELDIDPIKDLIPVCANCHAMLHRKSPALKPDELRVLLKKS